MCSHYLLQGNAWITFSQDQLPITSLDEWNRIPKRRLKTMPDAIPRMSRIQRETWKNPLITAKLKTPEPMHWFINTKKSQLVPLKQFMILFPVCCLYPPSHERDAQEVNFRRIFLRSWVCSAIAFPDVFLLFHYFLRNSYFHLYSYIRLDDFLVALLVKPLAFPKGSLLLSTHWNTKILPISHGRSPSLCSRPDACKDVSRMLLSHCGWTIPEKWHCCHSEMAYAQ